MTSEINRREMIIQAAERSFSLFGYKATTMDQVAKIANVAKGTIYTFFANKEELFNVILWSIIADMKSVTEETIVEERSFFENLYQSMDALLEFRRKHEMLAKLFQEVRSFGTPQAREGLEKVEQAILDYLERQLVNAGQRGEISSLDPKVVSFVMLKLYVALTLEWNSHYEPLSRDQIKDFMSIFLAAGLSTKQSATNKTKK
ncbi:TetR/AcrR family transcriptional regulator [Paenibacillus sanguinis]|uniref:TetR/AcrR family transcriptional regulator n=1 Tax=Paenibacillus sanguinis TaxID=225906 RepID=UPI00036D974A|nr:TetR/AcrR family transcriptional regulator [Paenibacillus sanguinis]